MLGKMITVLEQHQLVHIQPELSMLSFKLRNDNEERIHALLRMIQEHGTIQKYYWVSRFDETYITLFEPKIYDAFYIVIDALGTPENLYTIINEFTDYEHSKQLAERMFKKEMVRV